MQIVKTHTFISLTHSYDLNNNRKKCVKIDRETGSDEIFASLYEVNSDLENNIDNLRNHSGTKSVLEESLENELDSDNEPLNLLALEANNHVVEDPIIEKTLEEGSSRAENEVKGTIEEKSKEKDKGKSKGKSKEKEIKPGETEFCWGKSHAPYAKEQCSLKAYIIHLFPEHHISFDVFSAVTNLKLLVDESNLYARENGREFHTNEQEMR